MTEPNFASGSVWTGDNLRVLRGMNSACVDLIYLDPPFNSNRNYEAPIGSQAAGAAFKDAWTLDDVDVHEHGELADRNPAAHSTIAAARLAHGKGMMSYLIFMAVRLLEMHRVLKPAGSIYLHCDPTAGHYLKLLMDSVFGKDNFKNEIVWCYTGPSSTMRYFPRKHDTILFYAKGGEWTFNTDSVRINYTNLNVQHSSEDIETGIGGKLNKEGVRQYLERGKMPEDYWLEKRDGMSPVSRIHRERVGYPTQKPLALLERIVQASSNPGDMVLDPFCGCATTLVAADRLQRQWVGIDLSPLAIRLVNQRIAADRAKDEKKGGLQPKEPPLPWKGAIELTQAPLRTDMGKLPNYRTHRHRLYGEQEGVCKGCDIHFPFRVMDVDHILPLSKGGTDHPDNLQLLCSGCNRSKGGRSMAEWRAAQQA